MLKVPIKKQQLEEKETVEPKEQVSVANKAVEDLGAKP